MVGSKSSHHFELQSFDNFLHCHCINVNSIEIHVCILENLFCNPKKKLGP